MEPEKARLLLTGVTMLFVPLFIVLFGAKELMVTMVNRTEIFILSQNLNPVLLIFLVMIGVMLVGLIVSYALIRFEQRGTPSNRVLSKISNEVGDEPFQLKKVDGKWIAQTKENQDI